MIHEVILPFALIGLTGYTIKKVLEYFIARVKVKAQPQAKKGEVQMPNSILEGLMNAEAGLEFEIKRITDSYPKGKNPMDDAAYQKLIKDANQIRQWRERFQTNPLYVMFDQIGYPIFRELVPDGVSAVRRMIKGI